MGVPIAATSPEEAVADIRHLHYAGHSLEAHNYIKSLDPGVIDKSAVILEAARHYYVAGDFVRAAAILQKSEYQLPAVDESTLLSEEVAALSLLHARVEIRRNLAYNEAFALVARLDEMYIHLKSRLRIASSREGCHLT